MPFGAAESAQVNRPMGLIQTASLVIGVYLQQHKRFQPTSAVGMMFCPAGILAA